MLTLDETGLKRLRCKPPPRTQGSSGWVVGPVQAALGSSRPLTNWTASVRARVLRLKEHLTMRASPRMSRVMLKAEACPLRSARITSKPLIVA